MPPRAGKSYIISLFCSWWLGKYPTLSVMRNTGTARLYRKFSYDVRAILKKMEFKTIFPKVTLSSDKQNVDGWNTNQSLQVGYFGNGVGGDIIGFGANIAISDDLFKDMGAALSETVRESVDMWKQSAHNSRMETNCPEIFIGTRWSKLDEIGKAIDAGDIDIEVTIPALVDVDGTLKSFCENVKTTDEYMKIKDRTDQMIFDAEYMQQPGELTGTLFPESELHHFAPFDIPAEYKYIAVDPADTGGDNLSAPMLVLYEGRIYVTTTMYTTAGTDVTKPELVERIISNKVNHVEVEGNSGWILFGKAVRASVQERKGNTEVRIIKNTANKQVRILAQSAFIRNHFCFLEEKYRDDQYRKFMKVLCAYMRDGSTKADDAPDSLAMGAVYYLKNFPDIWK